MTWRRDGGLLVEIDHRPLISVKEGTSGKIGGDTGLHPPESGSQETTRERRDRKTRPERKEKDKGA